MSTKPARQPYTAPLDRLLTLGCPGGAEDVWREVPFDDYASMGIGPEHAAELRRLMFDIQLHEQDTGSASYGPVHASRALAALVLPETIPDFLELARKLDRLDYDLWLDDLPKILGHLGEAAIDPLARVARDSRESFGARLFFVDGLERIAADHPETRDRVVAVLADLLKYAEYTDPGINGKVIYSLVELRAAEVLPAIKAAYATGRVDEMFFGTLEYVEHRITLTPEQAAEEDRKAGEKAEARLEGMSPEEVAKAAKEVFDRL